MTFEYQFDQAKKRAHIDDEVKWIRLAQDGDIQAFECLVKKHQHRVLSIACRIVGNPSDAKDVAQEVFIRLYRFLPTFKKENKFFTWLYRIVINASFDFLRTEKRFQAIPLDKAPIEDLISNQTNIEKNEFYSTVQQLTYRLSTPQRTAFLLREMEGFSCREISKILECPEGTVRSYLYYARKRLKALLETHYPEFLEEYGHELSKR